MAELMFISHGGGPLPVLNDPNHRELVQKLGELGQRTAHLKQILVISAHWETPQFTITASAAPKLMYDYHGFPKAAYSLSYPAKGAPQFAGRVHAALQAKGIPSELSQKRGFDHGVFIPLMLMFPNAHIPVVQLSLKQNLDPRSHLQVGEALRALNSKDLLVIGSGFSFHNMQAFFEPNTEASIAANLAFDGWLTRVCAAPKLSYAQRKDHLIHWASAPYGRYCHPREEHLLPLHVCMGFAQGAALAHHQIDILKKRASLFHWSV